MSRFLQLAVRNVARNRRRSLITLAAIAFGVTAVVTMRGFVDGFITLLVDDVVQGSTGALQVHRKGYVGNLDGFPNHLNMPGSEEMVARLRSVPGVTGVSGRILFSGLVGNGRSQTMFVGRALDPVAERSACPRTGYDLAPGGEPLGPEDHAQALVGWELAKSFGAVTPREKAAALASGAPGASELIDSLTLASSSPEGRSNAIDVRVKGMTFSPTPFENKRTLTVPLRLAQELLGLEGRVTEYAVAVADIDELDRVAEGLRAVLGPEYEVHTWREIRPFFRDMIRNQRFVLGLVSLILFVIVLTGIINTMLMSVFERVREIGTMLAVGVRRGQVLRLFLLEAGVLGLAGGVIGAVVGEAIVLALGSQGIPMRAFGISQEVLLRPTVGPSFVLQAVAAALLGALLSAAYPAWKASRLDPVEALRSV